MKSLKILVVGAIFLMISCRSKTCKCCLVSDQSTCKENIKVSNGSDEERKATCSSYSGDGYVCEMMEYK